MGAKKIPISLLVMVPCENRLSVTVGMRVRLAGDSFPEEVFFSDNQGNFRVGHTLRQNNGTYSVARNAQKHDPDIASNPSKLTGII